MANHKLSLDIPDTANTCILRVVDTSIYNPDISIKCPRLQITVPGFSSSQIVDNVNPNFSLNLTACQLKVQTLNCGTTFNELPDGVFVIKWSISPNDYVFVEYNHLRTTKLLIKIKSLLCDLDLGACQPDVKIETKMRELEDLQIMLMAAKAKVENCREVSKGIELFKYVSQRLSKMNCRTRC